MLINHIFRPLTQINIKMREKNIDIPIGYWPACTNNPGFKEQPLFTRLLRALPTMFLLQETQALIDRFLSSLPYSLN